MVNASEFSAGLMHRMAIAFAKAGFTPAEVNELCENPQKVIRTVDVFRGYGHVTKRQWPFRAVLRELPDWQEERHGKPVRLRLLDYTMMDKEKYIFTRHADGLYANGVRLELHEATPAKKATQEHRKAWYDYAHVYEELRSVSNAGAGLAKFLLRYPHLIPEEWFPEESFQGRDIIFPGTLVGNETGEYPHGGPNVFAIKLWRDHNGKTSFHLNLIVTGGCYGEGLHRPSAIVIK